MDQKEAWRWDVDRQDVLLDLHLSFGPQSDATSDSQPLAESRRVRVCVCEVMSGMTSGVCVESDLTSMLQRSSAPSHHHPNHHGYGGQGQVSRSGTPLTFQLPGAAGGGFLVVSWRIWRPVIGCCSSEPGVLSLND